MSVVWEEPPVRVQQEVTLQEQLRERPGVWAKVLTDDRVRVSRLGGELHRQGFEVRPTDEPDEQGLYALFARWAPGERSSVVRLGGSGGASPDALVDTALDHVLRDLLEAARDGGDVDELLAVTRPRVKTLFAGVSTPGVQRCLQDAQDRRDREHSAV